jgi:heme oxygenase
LDRQHHREWLRQQSRAAHDELESCAIMSRLMSPAPSQSDYVALLSALYAWLPSFCATLDASLGPYAHPLISPLDLVDWLRADLEELAVGSSVTQASLPNEALHNPAVSLGAWYVLEGSVLGGAVIARHLQQRLGDALPLRYLALRGGSGHDRWALFDTHFERVLADSELLEPVLHGATTCYQLTARAMRSADLQ